MKALRKFNAWQMKIFGQFWVFLSIFFALSLSCNCEWENEEFPHGMKATDENISCIIHLVILKYLSSEWVRVRERERDIWWEPLTELFCKKEGKFIAFSLSLASTIAFRTLCIEFGWCMENEKEKLVMDTMKPFDVRGKKKFETSTLHFYSSWAESIQQLFKTYFITHYPHHPFFWTFSRSFCFHFVSIFVHC